MMRERTITIILIGLAALMVTGPGVSARPREWSEREAISEVTRDIRAHRIRFYWWGGYAPSPLGVPEQYYRVAFKYPKVDGGEGCLVDDLALRQRQRVFCVAYNTRMLSYILQKH